MFSVFLGLGSSKNFTISSRRFDLVLLLSARPSALLELRPGTALLVLICRELQPVQQILKALILHTDSIVGCLIVMPALVYVVQEV